MPNHVYNTITINGHLSQEQKRILSEIEDVGIAEYYIPMPKELNIKAGSIDVEAKELDILLRKYKKNKLISKRNRKKISRHIGFRGYSFKRFSRVLNHLKAMEYNKSRFGYINFYDWRIDNWGTKWGDYDLSIRFNKISYITAWSPLSDQLINLFLKDFPNIDYQWEEEQGFGEEYEYIDGEYHNGFAYDAPDYEEIEIGDGEYIYYLSNPYYRNNQIGYYSYNSFQDTEYFLSIDKEEAIEIYNNNK